MRKRDAVIPYYIVKEGRGYWQPNGTMRALGAKGVPCGYDGPEAHAKALQCTKDWHERKSVQEFTEAFKRIRTQDPAERGFVYFLRSGELIKIGFSRNPRKRLDSLKTGHPGEFVSILIVEGEFRHEQLLHQMLARYRFSGEWFRAAAPVLNVLAACVRAGRVETGTKCLNDYDCSPDVPSDKNFQQEEINA